MRNIKTVSVELDISDLMGLIDHCNRWADSIPKDQYDDMTMAGTTFGETVKKYQEKAEKFYEILNEIWPK